VLGHVFGDPLTAGDGVVEDPEAEADPDAGEDA
jgi:hypothetical protein